MDIDIVAEGDIKNIWDFDLEDKSIGMCQEPDLEFCFKGTKTKFQAGVMLMDLEKLRSENFEEKLLSRGRIESSISLLSGFYDQGLINKIFAEKRIKKMPVVFNINYGIFEYRETELDNLLFLTEFFGKETFSKIVLFHYTSEVKAWNIPTSRYYRYKQMMEEELG